MDHDPAAPRPRNAPSGGSPKLPRLDQIKAAAEEVLIAVEFATLNKHDLLFISGVFGGPPAPTVVGNEGYGRIIAVGAGVSNVKVGDRVLAPNLGLTWREQLIAPANTLFPLPDGDPQQLAQLSGNPPSAALVLSEYVTLRPGDWVVQNGGNSGVGRSLIAIAKRRGLRTISLVRRPELIAELKAAGGDVVLLDELASAAQVARIVGKDPVRLAIDSVGGAASATLVEILSDHGVLVTYAAASGAPLALTALAVIGKHLTIRGFFLGDFDHLTKVLPAQIEAAPLIAAGVLHVPVAAVYPITQIKQAISHLAAGGKILLEITTAR